MHGPIHLTYAFTYRAGRASPQASRTMDWPKPDMIQFKAQTSCEPKKGNCLDEILNLLINQKTYQKLNTGSSDLKELAIYDSTSRFFFPIFISFQEPIFMN